MFKKLLSIAMLSLFVGTYAFAQSGSVTGVVTDAVTGDAMPAVTVQIVELSMGTATDIDGEYTINNIPAGTYTLKVTFVGFKAHTEEVTVGSGEVVVDVAIQEDILGLEEVVVTGVGTGTSTQKLGFSVSKVSKKQLNEVPAADVGTALRSKVPGVTIVKASGDPSAAAQIRLRGSTSLGDDQSPLIIVDGVITDGSLADINMQDVESVEIVKGAAGASLYGSLAGNGVIQIITKRASQSIDKPRVTVRSEYGYSTLLQDNYPIATTHPWVNDVVVDANGYVTSWPGFGTVDADGIYDNEYPVFYDNGAAIYTGQPYNSNYVSISNSSGDFNYLASFENMTQSGVVENLEQYKRNSVRFNADYLYDEKFKLSFSGNYVNTSYPEVSEQGQGSNFFFSTLAAPPILDFTQKNPDGSYTNNPTGWGVIGDNVQNPLYVAENFHNTTDRDRFIFGITAAYNLTDWLSVNARQSLDKRYETNTQNTTVGYQTPTPSQSLNNGYEYRWTFSNSYAITELWAQANWQVDKLGIRVIGKYLYEDREYERYSFSGYNYSVSGIRSFDALDQATYSISNFSSIERAENFILDTEFDYDDKLILGIMGRRDGSSSFGADERYQFYYRGSIAYRITEDVEIDNIQELKVRASYGTSGQRPPFAAQYETYSAGSTVIVPRNLGNSEIKPSVVAETELGVDVAFLDKFSMQVNYATTTVTNDYLLVPLTGISAFSAQYQNVGEIQSNAFEVAFEGRLVNTRDFQAGFNLTYDMNSTEVTDLGGTPAFTRAAGGAINLFRFEEGVEYGAMYGSKLATSLSDLTVVDGVVANIAGGYTVDDFKINQLGHVILASAEGTVDERPIYMTDEDGNEEILNIGSTNPDFQIGLSGDMTYKGFGFYMVWDISQGGEVYNYSRQLLYNRDRHGDLETYTRMGIDRQYAVAADGLYNGSDAVSHFVEDASYIKLRELSLSYTIGNSMLGNLGSSIQDIKVSLVGRNLLTITDYSGYDPEVALRTNSTNFRLDEYSYPNFSTFSAAVQVRF